jgi:hypothetical protein
VIVAQLREAADPVARRCAALRLDRSARPSKLPTVPPMPQSRWIVNEIPLHRNRLHKTSDIPPATARSLHTPSPAEPVARRARTTNAIERLHEDFKRRIKTQTVLPSADTACMLFWALLASGQTNMRKVDGWQTLATRTIDQPI